MSKRKSTRRIVIHCAATDPSWHGPIDIKEIKRWHIMQRGWKDVGYHYYIRHSGAVEIGREEGAIGAHAAGYNSDSLAICLEGGLDVLKGSDGKLVLTPTARHFTRNQYTSLESLVLSLIDRYPEVNQVLGHRDLPGVNKACPSFDVRVWWQGLRSRADLKAKSTHTTPLGTPIDPITLEPLLD
jgi:N-acetylmuramoyl-L-alanine amidase